jgi:hypothetical protein
MNVVERHLEVASHRFIQGGPIQEARHRQQSPIDNMRIRPGAFLSVLAIWIDIDLLGEPLVNPPDILRIRKQRVDLRQSGRDHPSVIRRMNPASHQRLARPNDKLSQIPTQCIMGRPSVLLKEREGGT